jgi:hypothetical protein
LVLAASLVFFLAAGVAPGQPTFGRPKPTKKDKPETPKQTEPAPAQPDDASDIPEQVKPDMPAEKSPMFEPDASKSNFVASPEEWLDTDPPRAKPGADLTPGATFAWRSADGLRFTYTIPANYKAGEAYDVVVICHPHNNDFRWGMANHLSLKAAEERGSLRLAFRPNNVVVSVDGIGADARHPKTRYFPCDGASAVRFRDFMLELTRVLPARRFYLYGAGGGDGEVGGGGGQFVMHFAATFPALADGVIAYGTNAPPGEIGRCNVPTVIMHGVKNGLVPFADAVKVYDANIAAENKLVRLRALRSFNDYPNPVRVSECIDWLNAVRTDDAKEALASVESMLTPKGGDEYDYVCPVWYAGAREILGRILGEPGTMTGEAPLEGKSGASPEVRTRGEEIVRLLDAEAKANVEALRVWIPTGKTAEDLVLDAQPWLGHLIAARDDFRGVAPMEKFASEIRYDETLAAHKAAAEAFLADWLTRDDAENFAMAGEVLPRCFLLEWLPVNLPTKMKSWKKKQQTGELEVSAEALEGYENVLNWDEGYRKGLDGYQKIWRKWRFEAAKPAGAEQKP